MSSKFQLKRTAVSGRTPNTTSSSNTSFIDTAELALNVADGKLFTSDGTNLIEVGSNLTSLSVSTSISVPSVAVDYIDFANGNSVPSHTEGRVYYNHARGALTVYNDEAESSLQVGQEHWRRVYNNTGSTVTNGTAVYINGAYGNFPTIGIADASDATKFHVIGIATHDIETATYGYVTTEGEVGDLDLSAFSEGQDVYLSFSTPGGLTAIAPTFPNYPFQIGTVASNTATGTLIVHPSPDTFDALRVIGDARVDGDLTIAGNFTVVGNVTTTSATNLSVADNFVYVAAGDTISNTAFTGSGLNDAMFHGVFEGSSSTHYYVRIDSVGGGTGGVDTFEWSLDNFSTTEATGIDITTELQALSSGITIQFQATVGHTLNDVWDGTAAPVDTDFGVVGNFNNGTYQHAGFFRDATDSRFKVFTGYTPEPQDAINIDTTHGSFALADFQANVVFANLVGTANNASYFNGEAASFYVSNTYANTTFAKLAGAAFTGNVSFSATTTANILNATGATTVNTFQSTGAASFLNTITAASGAFFVSSTGDLDAASIDIANNLISNATSLSIGTLFTANSTILKVNTNDTLMFADGSTQNTAFRVYDSSGTRIA